MEFHKIKSLEVLDNYVLLALFDDDEWKKYDLKPLMEKYPPFQALKDEELYRKARIDLNGYGIVWNEDVDLSAEGIYLDGEKITKDKRPKAKAKGASIL